MLGLVAALGLAQTAACYSAEPTAAESSQDASNGTPGSTTASPSPSPSQSWSGLNLTPQNANGLCVDGVATTGQNVMLRPCSGSALQRFKWQEGSLELAGGGCLDLDTSAGTPASGTHVQMQPCDANRVTQLWVYGGSMIFPEQVGRTTPPSLCLAPRDAALSPNTTLTLAACDPNALAGTWDMSLYDGNTVMGFTLSAAVSPSTCMQVYQNLSADNTPVQGGPCAGSVGQKFILRHGTLQFSGSCVDIKAGGTAAGTPMQLYRCIANGNMQNFTFEHGQIHPWSGPNAGMCISLPDGYLSGPITLSTLGCSKTSTLSTMPDVHWVLGHAQL
jgi:hypothetical protein